VKSIFLENSQIYAFLPKGIGKTQNKRFRLKEINCKQILEGEK